MFSKYKLPLLLLALLLIPMAFGEYVPMEVKSLCYAISLTIKDILVLLLPLIIFSFLFNSLIALKQRAVLFIILLLLMVAVSNFSAITTGYTIGATLLPYLDLDLRMEDIGTKLVPLWNFPIPKLMSNEPAILLGISLGLYFALRPNTRVERIAKTMNDLAAAFLKRVFLPVLPIFILGFVLKLEYEGSLAKVFGVYWPVMILILSAHISYVLLVYFLASGLRPRVMFGYLKNMLPATITGFSTISSAATIPVNILCTEKNLQNSAFARVIIPTTANIHTLGSALGLTILALATIMAFGHGLPDAGNFFIFAFYYTMAKFAVAGIPGGVIIVVAPLLETYLGFTSEMVGLITAIYILLDPFGTATNVTCNGAFAIIFSKIYKTQEFAQVATNVENVKETV